MPKHFHLHDLDSLPPTPRQRQAIEKEVRIIRARGGRVDAALIDNIRTRREARDTLWNLRGIRQGRKSQARPE